MNSASCKVWFEPTNSDFTQTVLTTVTEVFYYPLVWPCFLLSVLLAYNVRVSTNGFLEEDCVLEERLSIFNHPWSFYFAKGLK